jgi:predicted TIM-barrel fold metal-dependent hydrolase
MRAIVDSDQHLYEYRGMWQDHIDPAVRGEALRFVDDDLGHTWMTWRDKRIAIADVQRPGQVDAVGDHFRRAMDGLPARERYDEVLPEHYWHPKARLAYLDELRVVEAFLFPNYGLLWERTLDEAPAALTGNLTAWNRWCATVSAEGGGRLHPVAHVTLRDLGWLERELATLSAAGVRLAMVAPALVDGKPLSHPDVDPAWSAFVTHGVTPIFHVAEQRRPFADAWYTDTGQAFVPTLESIFLWTGAALATADLVINGVFERHPDLRLGIVELSAMWVGQYLMMLDGATQFTSRINGRTIARLSMSPSDYFRRGVRVSAFAYEEPAFLQKQLGADLFMCGSDYPHAEGTATPVADYTNSIAIADAPGLFGDNADFLLRR